MEIKYLNAFKDNYIWLLQNNFDLIVVDPGDATPVLDYITANKLNLKAILLTHGHADHIGGVAALLAKYPIPVYGSCDIATIRVTEESTITLSSRISATVLATPGHTSDAVCYLIQTDGVTHLFCGDTLFAAGCGRVFTNDFVAMFSSLNKICRLPKATFIYPAHEYTLKNLEFAVLIEPHNLTITQRFNQEQAKLTATGITLPTSLELELQTNPFLRSMNSTLINSLSTMLGSIITPGLECFTKLRELRNTF
ncbi:MAG: hydroxyacylglutathione hydrolase [Burkholderiales bacterium]